MNDRYDGRASNELRKVAVIPDYVDYPIASVLIAFGKTRVLCNVSVSDDLPGWLKDSSPERGWLTAEYALLPGSTTPRTNRETMGKRGRTHEISRLLGRSLRAAIDLEKTPGLMLTVDCDVIQADGGTRTAAITGAYIALHKAIKRLIDKGQLVEDPLTNQIAAISVGVVDNHVLLDLNYHEDHRAQVDLNIVMNADGEYIEVQGTAESNPFSRTELNKMLEVASSGIGRLISKQSKILSEWD